MSAASERGPAVLDSRARQGSGRRLNGGQRLPPYGRQLRDLRLQGLVPAAQVVIGLDTWDYGKSYPRCVIPIDSEPAEFNFDFVAGLDVVLVWLPTLTTTERRDMALRALLAGDPISLRCIVLTDPIEWIWVKSRKHGLEKPEYLR